MGPFHMKQLDQLNWKVFYFTVSDKSVISYCFISPHPLRQLNFSVKNFILDGKHDRCMENYIDKEFNNQRPSDLIAGLLGFLAVYWSNMTVKGSENKINIIKVHYFLLCMWAIVGAEKWTLVIVTINIVIKQFLASCIAFWVTRITLIQEKGFATLLHRLDHFGSEMNHSNYSVQSNGNRHAQL